MEEIKRQLRPKKPSGPKVTYKSIHNLKRDNMEGDELMKAYGQNKLHKH